MLRFFPFLVFFFFKTAFHLAVVVGVFLKLAFPGLVADGAVQRVAGEQKSHYAAARFTGQGLSVRMPMFSATVFAQEMMGRGIHWMR